MPLPAIALKNKFIALFKTNGTSGISAGAGKQPVAFGTIEAVYSGATAFTAGDVVMFYPEKGIQVEYSTDIYWIVDEQYILFKEPAGAP